MTVLFADVVDSVKLYVRLGDLQGRVAIRSLLNVLKEQVHRENGTVLKEIGDAIMCTFDSPEGALRAAISMQRETAQQYGSSETPLSIRVAFHAGEVVMDSGDVFGDAVNVASRIVSQCRGRRILTTGETVRDIPRRDDSWRPELTGRIKLKGRSKGTDIWEILWGPNMFKTGRREFELERPIHASLKLAQGEFNTVLQPDCEPFRIGTDPSNKLVVSGHDTSREHATLEWFAGKFMLIDHSTNGTFIAYDGGEPIRIRNEQVMLHGSGLLGFGRIPGRDAGIFLRFECETYPPPEPKPGD